MALTWRHGKTPEAATGSKSLPVRPLPLHAMERRSCFGLYLKFPLPQWFVVTESCCI